MRDSIRTKAYFDEFIAQDKERICKFQDKLNSDSIDDERVPLINNKIIYLKTDLIIAKYSRGDSINDIKNEFEELIDMVCEKGDVSIYEDNLCLASLAYLLGVNSDKMMRLRSKLMESETYDYLIDFDSIDEDTAKKAKMMVVSYPLNPVCATAPDEFYDKLIAFAKKYNIIIIHDNAYSEIIYDGQIGGSFLSHEGAMEVGVEFNSLSKTYNLTGLRLSFLIGNREIVSKFKTVRSQFDYGTSFIYQKAAVAALNGPQGYVADNRAEYELRRNALVAGIKKLGLKPADVKGTMFVWAAIPDGYTNSADYVMELLNKTGVLCTPGSSFGSLGEGHVRFALVLPHEEIENIFSNL